MSVATSVAHAIATGAAEGMVNTHVIQVGGPNGTLVFSPENIAAQPGDLVQFQFNPKVSRSVFD
jgi:plastocyanin